MIALTIYSDVDGAYYGPDKKIHQTDGWVNYGTFHCGILIVPHIRYLLIRNLSVSMDMVKSFIAFMNRTDVCRYGILGK